MFVLVVVRWLLGEGVQCQQEVELEDDYSDYFQKLKRKLRGTSQGSRR
jgi:hypothetical protein